jgi:hypothetical protein
MPADFQDAFKALYMEGVEQELLPLLVTPGLTCI